MKLLISDGDRRSLVTDLPPGDAGVDATVAVCAAGVFHAARDARFQELARKCGTPDRLWAFMKRAFKFSRDPFRIEHIVNPMWYFDAPEQPPIPVDCDDVASFAATVLLCRGYHPVFIVAARDGNVWEHIYAGYKLNNRVIPFDAQDAAKPGEHPPRVARTRVYDLAKYN